jgi:hypothetical protein
VKSNLPLLYFGIMLKIEEGVWREPNSSNRGGLWGNLIPPIEEGSGGNLIPPTKEGSGGNLIPPIEEGVWGEPRFPPFRRKAVVSIQKNHPKWVVCRF